MKYLLFLFMLTFSFAHIPTHEYYVSNCHIEHNDEEKTLEIAFNIFTDDFEKALEQEAKFPKLFLGQTKEHEAADEYIFKYIQQHSHLKVNEKNVQLDYVGKEIALDGMWCYLTAYNIEKMDSISIASTFLYDTFPTQTNIFHCTVKGKEKNVWLRKEKSEAILLFEEKK